MKRHRNRNMGLIKLAGGTPPTEFRLFVKGWNATTKGRFLFDDEAAALVMAAFEEHGVDLAIDLEHQALEPGASPDPTSRDSRGWFRLELRAEGLFAVDVKWTPDGTARLTEKRQRYISPAFEVDPKTKRITKIINAALTALPATHNTPALVAAAARGETKMDGTLVQSALDALIEGDTEKCQEILKELIAAAASGGTAPKDEPAAGEPGDAPPEDVAARATLLRVTSTKTLAAAAAHVATLTRELQAVSVERDAYESAERVRLCSRLVVDAGRAPASVWATSDARVPKPFLQRMTIAELRAHVDEEIGASGGRRRGPRPPAGGDGDVSALSDREKAMCKQFKIDLADYAEIKARNARAVTP